MKDLYFSLNFRTNLPETPTMLPMKDYLKLAKKLIIKYVEPPLSWDMAADEDAVSYVANGIMMSDWRYDPSKGAKRESYREQGAIWAIGKYKRDFLNGRPNQTLPLHDNIAAPTPLDSVDVERKFANDILERAGLDPLDEKILIDKICNDWDYISIRDYYNIPINKITASISRSLDRLREVANAC
jgi:hypothetical protein